MTDKTRTQSTPGPWIWRFNSVGGQWALMSHADNLLEHVPTHVQTGGWPSDELTPDQHLISASPDLLLFAMTVRSSLKAVGAEEGSAVLAHAEEVIAKANGETS